MVSEISALLVTNIFKVMLHVIVWKDEITKIADCSIIRDYSNLMAMTKSKRMEK